MHIGINALLLSFSQNYRNGGVSHYIRYLLTELAKQPGEHEYSVFVNGKEVVALLGDHDSRITYIPVSWPETRPALRVAWEQFVLPSLLQRRHIDVLHSPVNVLPENVPAGCATITTMHDLAFLRFPEVLTPAKRLYHRIMTMRSLRKATRIIAVSESTKKDIHDLAGIPLERIQRIYPCIDERFSNVLDKEDVARFRQRHGLTEGYFLYLGTLEPRKNLEALIKAFHVLRQRYEVTQKLVLAGGKGWLYETIFTLVKEMDLEDAVLFPGFVAEEEWALWYQAAEVFVYPSLYEGFGLPVSEALACGTPVVTSNVSSLPEAGAELAICIDPCDIDALSQAMYQALHDEARREQCRALAPTVAARFSARTMVEQTLIAYEQAAHALQERSRSIVSVR